jgi:ATP-binding cassette subfamily C protein CydD
MMSECEASESNGLKTLGRSDERRLLKRLGKHGGSALRVACALPLASGLLLVGQAYLIAEILGRAIVGSESAEALAPLALGLIALIGTRILLNLAADSAGVVAAEKIKLALRTELFTALMHSPPDWKATRSSGALSTAIIDQTEALDGYFARFLPAMIQAAFLPLAFAVIIFPFDWVVGLLFLLTAPLIPLFMALVGWGAEAASRQQATAMSRLAGLFADRLRGIVTLNLFGRGEHEVQHIKDASHDLRRRSLNVLRIAFLSSAVLEFFAALGVAGVALYVGLTYLGFVDVRATTLGLQAGLFCLLMAPEVYQPLRLLAVHYHDKQSAKAALSEISARFAEMETLASASSATQPLPHIGATALSVRNLCLTTPGGRTILDHASLDLAAGLHAVILGESGIGKTSLLDAIAGLKSFMGQIEIGQHPIQTIAESGLRHTVAYLGQTPFLFAGTIADNIRFGDHAATPDDVRHAAALGLVLDFADRLPLGLDTVIGERGLGLSGGEAHRVAHARLFLRNPGLILLDEPTAHLDAETEMEIVEILRHFAKGRTMLISTHSAAVADRFDQVFRMENGKIVKDVARSATTPGEPRSEVAA